MSIGQAANSVDVNAAMLTVQALDLRRSAASYREIARTLGISISSAYKYVASGLAELRETARETAGEVRELEMERLDALQLKLEAKLQRQTKADPRDPTKQIPDPDESTVRAILEVQRRRADLLGLDAPKRTEFGGIEGGAPIPVALTDGRELLQRKLGDMLRRMSSVVVPEAALEVQAQPGLIAPSLSQNENGNAAKPSGRPDDYHKPSETNGQNGNGAH